MKRVTTHLRDEESRAIRALSKRMGLSPGRLLRIAIHYGAQHVVETFGPRRPLFQVSVKGGAS